MADNIDNVISDPIRDLENRSTSTNAKYKVKNSTQKIIDDLQKTRDENNSQIESLNNELKMIRTNRIGATDAQDDFRVIESLEREISSQTAHINLLKKEMKKMDKDNSKTLEQKIGKMKAGGMKLVLRRFGERTSGNKTQLRLRIEKLTKLFRNDCKKTADLGKLSQILLDIF